MIAAVTGASGFVGQNLVRRLRRDGHEVRCLVRPGSAETPPKASRHLVRFEEPKSLLECAALDGVDVVFHLAAATKAVSPQAFIDANVTPTRNLLGALTARRLHPRFVYVSSQAAAGPAQDLNHAVNELDAPHPVEAYGRSKLEAERIVESFQDHVSITIVRPPSVFGPYDRDFLTLFRFARRGLLPYPGIARHWFSVLHVDDVVDGLLATTRRPEGSGARTYFLSSEAPVQWRAFGQLIADALAGGGGPRGRTVRHVDIPPALVRLAAIAGDLWSGVTRAPTLVNRSKASLARYPYWVCSASRARAELGFRESRSLPDAVRDTYYWYRQSGWLRDSSGARGAAA